MRVLKWSPCVLATTRMWIATSWRYFHWKCQRYHPLNYRLTAQSESALCGSDAAKSEWWFYTCWTSCTLVLHKFKCFRRVLPKTPEKYVFYDITMVCWAICRDVYRDFVKVCKVLLVYRLLPTLNWFCLWICFLLPFYVVWAFYIESLYLSKI